MAQNKITAAATLRILVDGDKAFGPGLAQLFEGIEAYGSLRRSAAEMGMSYNKAWNIVKNSEALLGRPLVTRRVGGAKGGGAALTDAGRDLLARYRAFEKAGKQALAVWQNSTLKGCECMEPIPFCRGGGCTAKLGPAVLERILGKLPRPTDPALLVGAESSDDAAVYRLTDDLAIVQTLDFFPPMVEDPYVFGQIAAANALSDVYAMGGTVKTALNIVCFPEQMDLNILGRILQGGSEKVMEAGGSLAGGHSIADSEVKYGLSVTGVVHPDRIRQNNTGRAGDALVLTKPLGVGLVCTAARMGAAADEALALAVKSMTTLNKYAAAVADRYPVHACTDVTGFGLLGHLHEMTRPDLTARVHAAALPVIPAARGYADGFYLTAAAQRNRNFAAAWARLRGLSFADEEILFDPQTSGGLLFALDADVADDFVREIAALGLPCGKIGQLLPRMDAAVIAEP